MQPSLDADYFARVYSDSADPWNFATSAYEHAKYRATIDALGRKSIHSALEIGCSIGVLTRLLAAVCERLVSIDINSRALSLARERCAGLEHVTFVQMAFPAQMPPGRFDAIVVSEVAYYWSDADLAFAIDRIAAAASGGLVELVHYLPKVDDYVRDGDAVHDAFLRDPRFQLLYARRAERYRIDVLNIT